MTTPYVYFIGWAWLDKWYIGSREEVGCHPDELFNDSHKGKTYRTSQKQERSDGETVKQYVKKYGYPDFKRTIKYPDAKIKESLWIEFYNAVKDSRFLNHHGARGLGDYDRNDPVIKAKQAEKIKQRPPVSDETRERMSISASKSKRQPCSEETKRKIGAANKGKKRTPEQIAEMKSRTGLKSSMFGRKHSEETKKKMSEAQKGNKNWLGKKHSAEAIAKCKKANPSRYTKEQVSWVYAMCGFSKRGAGRALNIDPTSINRGLK